MFAAEQIQWFVQEVSNTYFGPTLIFFAPLLFFVRLLTSQVWPSLLKTLFSVLAWPGLKARKASVFFCVGLCRLLLFVHSFIYFNPVKPEWGVSLKWLVWRINYHLITLYWRALLCPWAWDSLKWVHHSFLRSPARALYLSMNIESGEEGVGGSRPILQLRANENAILEVVCVTPKSWKQIRASCLKLAIK